MSRQWRSDDTVKWTYGFGSGAYDATFTGSGDHTWDGTTRFQAQGSIAGTAGQTSFTKPSGWGHTGLCLLHQTQGSNVGNWELAWVDFSGASAVADKPLQNTYSAGAQIITLSNGSTGYRNVTVNGGVTLSAPAWSGATGGILAILASGTVTVAGAINASGVGFRPGAGANGQAQAGESYNIGVYNQSAANGNGGGGGYKVSNNFWGGGAGGGNANAGSNSYGSTGGGPSGNASLTNCPLGGGGGGAYTDPGTSPGSGGQGGGNIFIFAKTITIGGALYSFGGTGNGNSNGTGGGGGGAGGCILLKAKNATLGASSVANGGAGNTSGGDTSRYGGNGSGGRFHLDYSVSYSGSTTPALDVTNDLTIVEPASFMIMF
jgi:large repetitive protein